MPRRASVQIGNRRLERALREFESHVMDRVKEIVTETTLMIYNNATALVPVDDGALRNSISYDVASDGLSGKIEVDSGYAIYVEFGTGIYSSEGTGRQTPWVYWSNKLNRFVYTQGQKPQPFWYPSIDKGARYFRKEMDKLG